MLIVVAIFGLSLLALSLFCIYGLAEMWSVNHISSYFPGKDLK